jgi:asparagine synthetase B (glutamine-hydrolysing)
MSLKSFVISSRPLEGALYVNGLYLLGDFYQSDGHYFFFRYCLLEDDKGVEKYFCDYQKSPEQFVRDLNGDFLIADFDSRMKTVFLATDRLGKENAFLWRKEEEFLIGNSFWQIGEILKPTQNDINWFMIRRFIIYNCDINLETPILNCKTIPPASICKWDFVHNHQFEQHTYWELRFNVDYNISLDDAADTIYEYFDHTFQVLKNKYNNDTRFGIGLSGGLDSRILSHFTQKYQMNTIGYIVGEKYVHPPLKSNTYYLSKHIARLTNVNDLTFIEHDIEPYLYKIADDVIYAPLKSSDISICCLSALPKFDVMLNGEHGGVFFGEFKYRQLLEYRSNNMDECLRNLLSYRNIETMLLSKKEIDQVTNFYQQYIMQMNEEERRAILYRYFFERLALTTKSGFFETNFNTKERYGIYLDHDFMDHYTHWDPLFTVERTLQRHLFINKFTALAKIPSEEPDAPIYWSDSKIRNVPKRLMYAGWRVLVGDAMQRAKWLQNDKDYKKLYFKAISINQEIISTHFPQMDAQTFFYKNVRASATLIKMLIEIDVLLHCANQDKHSWIKEKYGYK